MTAMTTFFSSMLGLVADFLGSDPIIYLFGLVLLCFVIKAVKILITA